METSSRRRRSRSTRARSVRSRSGRSHRDHGQLGPGDRRQRHRRHLHADLRELRSTTPDLAFDAPAVTVENALKALTGHNLTVSQNGSDYEVKFLDAGPYPALLVGGTTASTATVGDAGAGQPCRPRRLHDRDHPGQGEEQDPHRHSRLEGGSRTGCSRSTSRGSARSRQDASVPDSSSYFTLLQTNPNLLVNEAQEANLLFIYDTDNPAS